MTSYRKGEVFAGAVIVALAVASAVSFAYAVLYIPAVETFDDSVCLGAPYDTCG